MKQVMPVANALQNDCDAVGQRQYERVVLAIPVVQAFRVRFWRVSR